MDLKKTTTTTKKKQDGVLSPDGVHCVPCPKQRNKIKGVVLNRVCILGFFFLNRVRVLNPQLLAYTQKLVEYPLSRNEPSAWWRQN